MSMYTRKTYVNGSAPAINAGNLNSTEDFLEILNRDLYRIDDVNLTYSGSNLTLVQEYISSTLFRVSTLTYSGSQLTNVNVIYYDTDGVTELLNYDDAMTYSGSSLIGVDRTVN